MSSWYEGLRNRSVTAGAAIAQFRFILRQSDGKYDQVSSAQGDADGVSGDAAAADGDTIPMVELNEGVVMVEAGAALATDGVLIAADAQGRAIAWVDAAGNVALGRLLGTAGAAGEIVSVQAGRFKVGAGT